MVWKSRWIWTEIKYFVRSGFFLSIQTLHNKVRRLFRLRIERRDRTFFIAYLHAVGWIILSVCHRDRDRGLDDFCTLEFSRSKIAPVWLGCGTACLLGLEANAGPPSREFTFRTNTTSDVRHFCPSIANSIPPLIKWLIQAINKLLHSFSLI